MKTLEQRFREGLRDAIAQSGKNKGRLKAVCPKMNTYGAAVWQGMMADINPYKVSFIQLYFMDDDVREVYAVTQRLAKIYDFRNLDSARVALENIGIW